MLLQWCPVMLLSVTSNLATSQREKSAVYCCSRTIAVQLFAYLNIARHLLGIPDGERGNLLQSIRIHKSNNCQIAIMLLLNNYVVMFHRLVSVV